MNEATFLALIKQVTELFQLGFSVSTLSKCKAAPQLQKIAVIAVLDFGSLP